MSIAGPRLWLDPGREAGLVIAAQRGDAGAFVELLRAYRRPAWALCLALVRDSAGAVDLLEEAAARAFVNIGQTASDRPFLPWFARQLRAVSIVASRRRAGSNPGFAALGASASPDRWLFAAFDRLPPEDRMLLALRDAERRPYHDLAPFADMTPHEVLHRLGKVRHQLDAETYPEAGAA